MFLYIYDIVANQANWDQTPQIMSTNTQEAIWSVKLHIPHKIEPYSNVNTIWGLIYACFCVFGGIDANQGKWAQIHKS